MKRIVLTSAAAIVLLGLGALWFVTAYERVPTKVWVGPSGAARTNPYLAAMRFIERAGMKSTLIERAPDLDTVPPGATLILLAGRASLTPDRARSLQQWAGNGGHLIVEPERLRSRDLMLDTLGIGRLQGKFEKPTPTMTIELPGAERALQVTPSGREVLDPARISADVTVSDSAGLRIASMRHGAGRITVVTGMHRFQNRIIGAHDNAELLWQILDLAPSNKSVFLLRPPQSLPLWDWLREYALGTLIAAFVLAAVWLWRATPRFGPLRPDAPPERRQLLEHIRACGRFRWANGARGALLAVAREICQRHITMQQPRLAHVPLDRRYQELSVQLGIGAGEIALAFDATPRTGREFVQAVAALASIHSALRSAGAQRIPRRKKR